MTGDLDVTLPIHKTLYWLEQACAGGFTVTVKTPAGANVTLVNGEIKLVRVDGTDVKLIIAA